MSFSGSLLDILTFGVSKRRSNSNDTTDGAFVDMIKQYPDLWREAFTGNNVLCCPLSVSLGEEATRPWGVPSPHKRVRHGEEEFHALLRRILRRDLRARYR